MKLSFERLVAVFLVMVAAATVAGVFFFEYVLEVRPCILCLYQRLPFYSLIFIGGALFLRPGWFKAVMAVCAILFLGNSGLAVYNILVENNVVAGIAGCSVAEANVSVAELKAALAETSNSENWLRACNDVSWTLFGIPYLTLAVMNAILSFGLAVLCALLSFFRSRLCPSIASYFGCVESDGVV